MFLGLVSIGSDRDEEGKSSLFFINMDNDIEYKVIERLRKFIGSFGSFSNF